MGSDRRSEISDLIADNLGVLNRLESHLGCAQCRGPLVDGRCLDCQGDTDGE
jgi:hypothetical protein